jgi:hypothetical protein
LFFRRPCYELGPDARNLHYQQIAEITR